MIALLEGLVDGGSEFGGVCHGTYPNFEMLSKDKGTSAQGECVPSRAESVVADHELSMRPATRIFNPHAVVRGDFRVDDAG